MERSAREGRGKRKIDALDKAINDEDEKKAKRAKKSKSAVAIAHVSSSKSSKNKPLQALIPVLTPAQAAKADAKAVAMAKKAQVKKKKDDKLLIKKAKEKARIDKKTAKAVAEKAFIQPYLAEAENCFKGESGVNITVTRAKSEYRLNENDLGSLRYFEKTNPHYKSAAPMRLYDEGEVAAVCKSKYQTKEVLARKFAMRAQPRAPRVRAPRVQEFDDDSSNEGSNDLVCGGCGNTAAVDCTLDRCCHCCDDPCCIRHRGFY
jgi:hypothetical protein